MKQSKTGQRNEASSPATVSEDGLYREGDFLVRMVNQEYHTVFGEVELLEVHLVWYRPGGEDYVPSGRPCEAYVENHRPSKEDPFGWSQVHSEGLSAAIHEDASVTAMSITKAVEIAKRFEKEVA